MVFQLISATICFYATIICGYKTFVKCFFKIFVLIQHFDLKKIFFYVIFLLPDKLRYISTLIVLIERSLYGEHR